MLFCNWKSFHLTLSSHFNAWSYKKNTERRYIKADRKDLGKIWQFHRITNRYLQEQGETSKSAISGDPPG